MALAALRSRVARLLEAVRNAPLRSALKAYAAFAVVHMAWKAYVRIKLFVRARLLLKNVAGQQFQWLTFDWLGVNTMRNMQNYFDWRGIPLKKHQGADLVGGPGPFIEVMCNDRSTVKHMLKDDFNAFTKPAPGDDYLLELMGDFLGANGIFVLQHGKGLGSERLDRSHEEWYNQRKTAAKIFTKSTFSTLMLSTFVEKAHLMKTSLLAQQGKDVDMQRMFFRFTFDSIQRVFFGRNVDTVSGKETDEYAQAFDKAHRAMVQIYFRWLRVHVACQMVLPYPFGTWGTPESGWSLTMSLIRRVTPEGREFAHWCSELNTGTYNIIKEARADPNLPNRRDLLANFLNANARYTDKDLRDIVLNFIIAGRDTTACTLSWLFFNLACHPEVQDRVASEANAVLKGCDPTYESLQQMPFLMACVYESLRLNPPVPEDYKVASRDSVFPDQTVVPKGTKVTFHNYGLARNPSLYEDPEEFKPTRWIDDSGALKKLDTYYSPIFQAGSRECLGKSMAELEIAAVASMLLADTTSGPGLRFDVSDEERSQVTWALMITQSVSNALDRSSHNLFLSPSPRAAAVEQSSP